MPAKVVILFSLTCASLLPACASAGEASLKPTPLEKLNTKADEDNPFITADNLNILYDSNASGRFEIMHAKRTSIGGAWSAPKSFLAAKDYDVRSPHARGNILYFAQNKVPDEKLKDLKNFDLYQRSGGMAPLPLLGVSREEDELHPWLTATGKEFYFSRKFVKGWMLFVAQGPSPGPIGKEKEVGFPAGFGHATLSANGLTMYLEGPAEKDRVRLYRAKRAKIGGAWAAPEPLRGLEHAEGKLGDIAPCLSPDGSRLYFASDRPGGEGGLDLWMIPTKDLK